MNRIPYLLAALVGCGSAASSGAASGAASSSTPSSASESSARSAPSSVLEPTCGDPATYQDGEILTRPDGFRLWYRVRGPSNAPTVLYVHGGPGYNAHAFDRAVGGLLAEHVRLVVLDQRGCGRSATGEGRLGMDTTVADFDALRRTLGIDTWVLLGHSFGGLLAVEYARRHPGATSGLILVETTTHLRDALTHQVAVAREISPRVWPERAAAIESAAESDVPPLDRLLRIYGEVGVASLQRQLHWHDPSAQARADGWDETSGLLRCTQPTVLQAYREEGWIDSAPPHSNAPLPVPGILIGGRHSEVIGTRNLQESANVWGVPLRWMEQSGHFPYVEEPGEFVNLVVGWTLERARHVGAR